jgi:uncharacterized protein (TIGR03437 family)
MPGEYSNRLAGSRVKIGDRAAQLLYASPGQVNAMVPADVPAGSTNVTLETAGGAPVSRPVDVVPAVPAVFVLTAQPGAITAWATGLGGLTPEARLNGAPARVLFSGGAPGFPGLDQINIEAAGGVAQLQLSAGGATFFEGEISVPAMQAFARK